MACSAEKMAAAQCVAMDTTGSCTTCGIQSETLGMIFPAEINNGFMSTQAYAIPGAPEYCTMSEETICTGYESSYSCCCQDPLAAWQNCIVEKELSVNMNIVPPCTVSCGGGSDSKKGGGGGDGDGSSSMVVPVVIVVILAIMGGVGGFFFYRRRRQTKAIDQDQDGKKKGHKGRNNIDDDDSDDDDDDDDDDIPLSALKIPSPLKKKKVASKSSKKGSAAKAKAKPKLKAPTKKKAKTSATKSTSSASSTNDYSSPSFALYGTESNKGQLIQKLLCRWWYAISWPDPSSIPNKPPLNYDAMDGFPGVYICTHGDEVGTIKDLRDKSKTPCFNNFANKTSEELRDLLMKAIKEQKLQLCESEGSGTSTEKELNVMLKWATKLNVKKADIEAAKVLKANKLSIPE